MKICGEYTHTHTQTHLCNTIMVKYCHLNYFDDILVQMQIESLSELFQHSLRGVFGS